MFQRMHLPILVRCTIYVQIDGGQGPRGFLPKREETEHSASKADTESECNAAQMMYVFKISMFRVGALATLVYLCARSFVILVFYILLFGFFLPRFACHSAF